MSFQFSLYSPLIVSGQGSVARTSLRQSATGFPCCPNKPLQLCSPFILRALSLPSAVNLGGLVTPAIAHAHGGRVYPSCASAGRLVPKLCKPWKDNGH